MAKKRKAKEIRAADVEWNGPTTSLSEFATAPSERRACLEFLKICFSFRFVLFFWFFIISLPFFLPFLSSWIVLLPYSNDVVLFSEMTALGNVFRSVGECLRVNEFTSIEKRVEQDTDRIIDIVEREASILVTELHKITLLFNLLSRKIIMIKMCKLSSNNLSKSRSFLKLTRVAIIKYIQKMMFPLFYCREQKNTVLNKFNQMSSVRIKIR